jgi:hypothetical protein
MAVYFNELFDKNIEDVQYFFSNTNVLIVLAPLVCDYFPFLPGNNKMRSITIPRSTHIIYKNNNNANFIDN